jgi:anthranilate/para-aminobenzoate synthase component I
VVIRTLIIQGNRFMFQAGGGIVADSSAKAELEEVFVKTRAITKTLGIDEAMLYKF